MQTPSTRRNTRAALAVLAIALALPGCGSREQSGPGSIPANGSSAQIQQAIQQNAARQAAAVKNMPPPGAPAPAAANR